MAPAAPTTERVIAEMHLPGAGEAALGVDDALVQSGQPGKGLEGRTWRVVLLGDPIVHRSIDVFDQLPPYPPLYKARNLVWIESRFRHHGEDEAIARVDRHRRTLPARKALLGQLLQASVDGEIQVVARDSFLQDRIAA